MTNLNATISALTTGFVFLCTAAYANPEHVTSPETEAGFMHVPSGFTTGTIVLGILAEKFPRDKVLRQGWINKHWYPRLLEAGYNDADLVDGSEVSAMSYCYGHNSRSGCGNQGLYFAHVPAELRDQLVTGNVGNVSDTNDIVEIELRQLPSTLLFGTVKRIHRRANDWGNCHLKFLSASKMYIISPYGPPIGLWLTCEGLKEDGWTGLSVRGAPLPSGTDEGESANIHEWRKIPSSGTPENPAQ